MNRQRLEQLARRWQQQRVLRDGLFALAAAGFLFAITGSGTMSLSGFLVTLLAGIFVDRPWRVDAALVGRHLNRTCPELEESAALFLRPPEALSLLETLQLNRVGTRLLERPRELPPPGQPPGDDLHLALLCLIAGLLAATIAGVAFRRPVSSISSINPAASPTLRLPSPASLPKIVGNTFKVTPPAYTGHAARSVQGFTTEAEEGASVAWSIELDRAPRDARLVAGSVAIPLHRDGQCLEGAQAIGDSTLFALTGTLSDGAVWNPPELFSIKVLKDQPPVVRVVQPARTRTEIVPPVTGPFMVEASITDDYGVADAHLVATVAKGSGESVKFREQTIPFDPGNFSKALDLAALGMEAGDELYFFVEATDNRQPTANRTHSETRFVRLRGPEERQTTTGRGVAGINLVPQYFRSERQLIIDTEKLLADRTTLSETEFRVRANDLGVDQGLLRLRYGRFLGEDQEDSALTDHLETSLNPLQAAAPAAAPGPHAAASIAERFRQEHTAQDREGGGEDVAPRSPSQGAPLTAEQVRQPFVDSHDQHDKNTFFDNGTKGTMRDALAAMWTAEGLLRTARPEEALAPEHQALEILKDLQQSDRAYVQHVGFEAPPLKVAERRLKGEVTDVPERAAIGSPLPPTDPALVSVRAALLELTQTGSVTARVAESLLPGLTAAATRQPETFLPGLQAMRGLRTGRAISEEESAGLQRALLRLLPAVNPLPDRLTEPAPELAEWYYKNAWAGRPKP